jgi:predicted Zn-dependent protease
MQGFEPECLRARAELLRGEPVAALAALERARALDSSQPELFATEAEILATLDRIQAAADVLAQGLRLAGADPALLRAQGVIELRNQGRGRQALEALERARARDPELPFLKWPLAQAHLLVGRGLLEKAPAEATFHARAARALWPELDDARELEAEGLAGELRFEEAIALYEELETRGRSYGETPAILHQRCATRCLLEHERARAVEHYLAARALGMNDEGLGFGLELLVEESQLAVERGLSAAEGGDWVGAEGAFARALELVPGDLVAEDHLAVARFQRANYRGAAEAWERVLARAEKHGVPLADPVPLNLAKAWRMAGERAEARGVLSRLLDREPEGLWSAEARELLLVLEAEELAGQ